MDLRLVLAIVLIVGYIAFKGFERSGAKLPLGLSVGKGRSRALPARKPPMPEKLEFERVTLDATPANLQAFIRLTGSMERLGFGIVADYVLSGWPDTYCRGLVHQDKPVHAVIVERLGLPAHVELFTLFDDLSALVTSASEEAEDPSKPVALRYQQIPGLTLDELYVQHLSTIENLHQDQLSPMPATRLAFFEHQRALLVIEHELRKAKRALRTDSLSRVLDALPELPVRDLLKRYGLAELTRQEPAAEIGEPAMVATKTLPAAKAAPAEQHPDEPADAPKRWGVGSSLLSRRMAAREAGEEPATPAESAPEPEGVKTLVLDPEPLPDESADAPVLEVIVEEANPPLELPPEEPEIILIPSEEPVADAPLPFEIPAEEPTPEATTVLPVEPEARDLLPFEVFPEPATAATLPEPAAEPEVVVVPAAEPRIQLPFELVPEAPAAIAAAPTPESVPSEAAPAASGSKPTCPHCGATLFSSLSSRCSKCKQAVR